MADHFFDSWGGVGVLVNNAGVADVGHMGEVKIESWQRIIETNLWGVIYGCHFFVPRMKSQGGGHRQYGVGRGFHQPAGDGSLQPGKGGCHLPV